MLRHRFSSQMHWGGNKKRACGTMSTGRERHNIYNRLKFRMSRHPFNCSTSVCTSTLSLSFYLSAPLSLTLHPSISAKDTIPAVVTMETSPEGLWARHVRDCGWLCVRVCVCVCTWACLCANLCPCLFSHDFSSFVHICFLIGFIHTCQNSFAAEIFSIGLMCMDKKKSFAPALHFFDQMKKIGYELRWSLGEVVKVSRVTRINVSEARFCKTTDKLKLKVSLGSFFKCFLLSQGCAQVLVRFRQKSHLTRVRKTAGFGCFSTMMDALRLLV